MVTATVIENGILNELKKAICKTPATRYNLKDAPISLEIRKKKEPVLYDFMPNLWSRKEYIETKFSL